MFKKLLFFIFFLVDLYFIVSGLLYLRSPGEAVYGFFFLIFMWYIVWSINKIIMYVSEKKETSFIRYYFSYLLNAVGVFGKEKQLGPTKIFRIINVSLSGLIGVVTILFLIYYNLSITVITEDLFLRYVYVFLYISVYPLVTLIIQNFYSGENMRGLLKNFFNFFPLRFTQLFAYLFTFLTPVAWIAIAFLSYIVTKSKTICEK